MSAEMRLARSKPSAEAFGGRVRADAGGMSDGTAGAGADFGREKRAS